MHLWIDKAIQTVPREHLRGIDRIRIVDEIADPRVRAITQRSNLPGLYHPKQGTQAAWIEVAAGVLLPSKAIFYKRIMPRLSFKGNLSAVIFSLIGQHYYLTLRHSVKKSQVEPAVKSYTEKYLRIWHEKQHSFRTRLFKPFQPTLERWGKALQKKALASKKSNAL